VSEIARDEKEVFATFERRSVAAGPAGGDEGLGTVYERVVINRFLTALAEREGLGSVLEHPADGVTGQIGCNSLALGQHGRRVTLANPVPEALQAGGRHWQEAGVQAAGLVAGEVDRFPFAADSFDLVWSFCVFERFTNPEVLVAEMARVSRRYVLLMTQNAWNLGTGLHAAYHLARRQPWDHGSVRRMAAGAAKRVLRGAELRVVDAGPIDTPPWVDTWDMPMRGYLRGLLGLLGRRWEWRTPGGGREEGDSRLVRFLAWVEGELPRPTVFWQTHHWYVLGEKPTGRPADGGE
jgi:SAM-dependent methyltransferase